MLTVQLLMLSKHSLRFWHCNRASALHMDCLPVCRWSQLEDEWSPFGNGNQKVYGPFPKDFAYSYTSVFVESVFIIERPLQTIRACNDVGFPLHHYNLSRCTVFTYPLPRISHVPWSSFSSLELRKSELWSTISNFHSPAQTLISLLSISPSHISHFR